MLEQIFTGDCRTILPTLEAQSVQCCVTSPPYWGLRDYGTAEWEGGHAGCDHRKVIDPIFAISTNTLNGGKKTTGHLQEGYKQECLRCGARRIDQQLGLESTPQEYIAKMVAVFREVWRVLRDDGTLWLNLGDSYAGGNQPGNYPSSKSTLTTNNGAGPKQGDKYSALSWRKDNLDKNGGNSNRDSVGKVSGLKPKDLCMMPARLAMALQADGWYLRSDIIWAKPNPMPESVTDRPTKAHEYIFLLTKAERYFYDAEAIRELNQNNGAIDFGYLTDWSLRPNNGATEGKGLGGYRMGSVENGRNKRSVWTIATQPYAEAHFATFPEEIPKICILAGSRPGDVVLDPFTGSGTTGKVAIELGRKAILIELNPAYIELARKRTFTTPGFL